jgi:hypothetical protein
MRDAVRFGERSRRISPIYEERGARRCKREQEERRVAARYEETRRRDAARPCHAYADPRCRYLSLEYLQDAGSTILIAGTFGPPSERHLRVLSRAEHRLAASTGQ